MRSKGQIGYEMVLAGFSHAEAARQLGITTDAVSQVCRRNGLRGVTEAGRRTVSAASSAYLLSPAGKAMRAKSHVAYRKAVGNPDPIAVVRYVADHHTFEEAAQHFGITRNQVAGYVWRNKKRQA